TVLAIETTAAVSAPTVMYRNDAVVTVSVSAKAGMPTGTVTLTLDGGQPTSAALVNGVATFTLASPNAADHSLSATYLAQGSFGGSSASGTLHVEAAATTTAITAPSVTSGRDAPIIVTVASSSGGVPSGNVTLRVDGGEALTQPL